MAKTGQHNIGYMQGTEATTNREGPAPHTHRRTQNLIERSYREEFVLKIVKTTKTHVDGIAIAELIAMNPAEMQYGTLVLIAKTRLNTY